MVRVVVEASVWVRVVVETRVSVELGCGHEARVRDVSYTHITLPQILRH